jgi:hypothetical protein
VGAVGASSNVAEVGVTRAFFGGLNTLFDGTGSCLEAVPSHSSSPFRELFAPPPHRRVFTPSLHFGFGSDAAGSSSSLMLSGGSLRSESESESSRISTGRPRGDAVAAAASLAAYAAANILSPSAVSWRSSESRDEMSDSGGSFVLAFNVPQAAKLSAPKLMSLPGVCDAGARLLFVLIPAASGASFMLLSSSGST